MKVRFKKLHKDAVIPTKSYEFDAGFDLTAVSKDWNSLYDFWEYNTGLAIQIPKGFVGKIYQRSSVSKKDLFLCNATGIIDSGYNGEISFRFKDVFSHEVLTSAIDADEVGDDVIQSGREYQIGDKIGQLIIMPIPSIEFEEVEELSDTERGRCGYGSTDKKEGE